MESSSSVTWVQCEDPKCMKWRKVTKALAESVKEVNWFCHMNPDKSCANCDVEQEEIKAAKGEVFVFSLLEEGSIVWVKLSGYPRWPGIICSDITQDNYTSFDADGDIKYYHVEYFGDPRTHSWALAKHVEVYGSGNAPAPISISAHKAMTTARSRKSFQVAVQQADKLVSLPPKDRLSHCIFHAIDPLLKIPSATAKGKDTGSYSRVKKASDVTTREVNKGRSMSPRTGFGEPLVVSGKEGKGRTDEGKSRANGLASYSCSKNRNTVTSASRGRKRQSREPQRKRANEDCTFHAAKLSDGLEKNSSNPAAVVASSANAFSQSGICLLNINGVVVPAILPMDRMQIPGSSNRGQPEPLADKNKTFTSPPTCKSEVFGNGRPQLPSNFGKEKCTTERPGVLVYKNGQGAVSDSVLIEKNLQMNRIMQEAPWPKFTSDGVSCKGQNPTVHADGGRKDKNESVRTIVKTTEDRSHLAEISKSFEKEVQAKQMNSYRQSLPDGQPLLDTEDEIKLRRQFKTQFNHHADMICLDAKDRCIKYERKQLDMYRFYNLVVKAGGFKKASKPSSWQQICKTVTGLNTDSKFLSLKKCYQRTLLQFEEYMKTFDGTSSQLSAKRSQDLNMHTAESSKVNKAGNISGFIDRKAMLKSPNIYAIDIHNDTRNLQLNKAKLDEMVPGSLSTPEESSEADDIIDQLMGLNENELGEQILEEFESLHQQLKEEEMSLYVEEGADKVHETLEERNTSNDPDVDEDSDQLFQELAALHGNQ